MKSALETIFMDTVEDKSRDRTMVEKKKKKKRLRSTSGDVERWLLAAPVNRIRKTRMELTKEVLESIDL